MAATIRASRPGWGPVHLLQRVHQARPIALGETLTLPNWLGVGLIAAGAVLVAWRV